MSRRERAAAPTASLFRWCTVGLAGYTAWLVANLLFVAALPVIGVLALADRRREYASLRRAGAAFLRFFFGGYATAIGVLRLAETPGADAAAPSTTNRGPA